MGKNDSDSEDWMEEKKPKPKTPKADKPGPKATKDKASEPKKPKAVKAKPEAPPKMSQAKTPEQILAEEEAERLKKRGRLLGVTQRDSAGEEKALCDMYKLKPSAPIRKHTTAKPQEILKKASQRKNKALFLFPGLVSVVKEGKMGQLYDLDKNPVLEVEFPKGKLRLKGTHVYTKQKFMTLLPKGKKMQAQDMFDHLVVFSEHHWIGKPEDKPTVNVPEDATESIHSNFLFDGGASGGAIASEKKESSSQQSISSFLSSASGASDAGRTKRAAASKTIRYTDGDVEMVSDDDSEDAEDDDDDTGTRSPVKLPIPTGLPEIKKPAPKMSRSNTGGSSTTKKATGSLDLSDLDDDDSPPAKRAPNPSRPASAKKTTYVLDDDSEDEDESDGEEEVKEVKKKPAAKKPAAPKSSEKKVAAKPAPKKATPAKRKAKDSDEEEDSDSEDSPPPKKKPAAKKATPPKKKAAPKKKKKTSDSEEDEESDSPEDDDDDDDWP